MPSIPRRSGLVVLCCAIAIASAIGTRVRTQARSAPDWTTGGADAQRSSWVAADPFISLESLPKFQFLWKLKVDNEPRGTNALTAPVALGNLMTFRGFKSLVFVGGSSNDVYAIDYDFGTLFWKTHINYASGAHEFAGSQRCPGGMTSTLTRATNLIPATGLSFFGFARPPRAARGEVGEPGRGSPRMTTGRPAAPAPTRGADTPARGAEAPARGGTAEASRGSVAPNFVFALPADGIVRALNPHTGDLAAAPAQFLPANATAAGMIWTDDTLYAATINDCGSAPPGIWAMDWQSDMKSVSAWRSEGPPLGGFALGSDGTLYATTGAGKSTYANAVVALTPKTLAVKGWFAQQGAVFHSPPIVFSEGTTNYVVAAAQDGRLFVLDAAAPGGADHVTALSVTPADSTRRFGPAGLATWRDPQGARWVLAPTAGAITAFKLADRNGRPSLEVAWTSRDLVAPRTPIIVNGVVFALSGGQERGPNAVLYALDPSTGKDLWNSGSAITSFATSGLSAGTAQIYVVTYDNTVWSFGIPIPY